MNWDIIGMLNSLDPHGGGFFHLFLDAITWLSMPLVGLWAYLKMFFKKKN